MKQSNRLIANALITFGRMGFTVVIGLVTARVVFRLLGGVDYGLLTALGAAGVVLPLINSALTQSGQRHFAYEIGRKDHDRLAILFNSALVVHLMIAGLCVLAALTLGDWVTHFLSVPDDRRWAAASAFRFSMLAVAASVAAMPYRALLAAHQAVGAIAATDLLIKIVALGSALLLSRLPGDHLVTYTLLNTIGAVLASTCLVGTGFYSYAQLRPRFAAIHFSALREIGIYAFWSLLGIITPLARGEGAVLVLNRYFGPLINASYAVGDQLAGYPAQVPTALLEISGAAVVSLVAANNWASARNLIMSASKLPPIFGLMIGIPIALETPTLLRLWLGSEPPYAAIFIQLEIITLVINLLSGGLLLGLQALGKIGIFSIGSLILESASLLLAGIAYHYGKGTPALLPSITLGLVAISKLIFLPVLSSGMLELPVRVWFRGVVVPVAAIGLLSCGAAALAGMHVENDIVRLLVVTVTSSVVVVASTLSFGLNSSEWERVRGACAAVLRRWTSFQQRHATHGG